MWLFLSWMQFPLYHQTDFMLGNNYKSNVQICSPVPLHHFRYATWNQQIVVQEDRKKKIFVCLFVFLKNWRIFVTQVIIEL